MQIKISSLNAITIVNIVFYLDYNRSVIWNLTFNLVLIESLHQALILQTILTWGARIQGHITEKQMSIAKSEMIRKIDPKIAWKKIKFDLFRSGGLTPVLWSAIWRSYSRASTQ